MGFAALSLLQARLRAEPAVGKPRYRTCLRPFSAALSSAAPHFPEPLGDTAVEVGESVSLLCRVEGSPPPRVTWSRQDGKPVTGWHGPRGVSSELEAAELFIDSKRAERASVCWRGGEHRRASRLGAPLGALPCLLQAGVPAVGLAPMPIFAAVKH